MKMFYSRAHDVKSNINNIRLQNKFAEQKK